MLDAVGQRWLGSRRWVGAHCGEPWCGLCCRHDRRLPVALPFDGQLCTIRSTALLALETRKAARGVFPMGAWCLATAPLARLRRADLLIVAMEPGPPRAVQGLHRGGVLPDRISIATTPFRDASFRSRASERVASLVGPLEAAPPGAPACVAMGPFAGQSAGTEGQGRSCCCRLRSVISGHPRCRRHPVGCVTHSGFAVALTAAFTVTASVPGQAADGRKAAACSRLCRGCRRGHSDWP